MVFQPEKQWDQLVKDFATIHSMIFPSSSGENSPWVGISSLHIPTMVTYYIYNWICIICILNIKYIIYYIYYKYNILYIIYYISYIIYILYNIYHIYVCVICRFIFFLNVLDMMPSGWDEFDNYLIAQDHQVYDCRAPSTGNARLRNGCSLPESSWIKDHRIIKDPFWFSNLCLFLSG
jgi:hypothetical protein